MSRGTRLEAFARREARRLGGKMGICLERLEGGPSVEVSADETFPLASVFKVGVLVELFRRADRGEVRLGERWTVRKEVQSLESGVLMFLEPGLRPTVRDLATLMIIVSDNTATDMIFKKLGLRSVNRTLRDMGLRKTDIYFPNREWFLLCLGFDPHFQGRSPAELARTWNRMGPEARYAEVDWLMRHLRGVSLKALERRARSLLPRSPAEERARCRLEQATDNVSTPRDMARLLAAIVHGKAASARSCRSMISILKAQQYHRLADGLPPHAEIASKTGSIAGVVNDAGIVYPRAAPPFVAVCLTRDLTPRQSMEAPRAIARIAKAAWDSWA